MMGLFAIREILHQSVDLKEPRMHISMQKTSFLPHLKEMKGCAKPIALGCLIGTGIGILPGIGQNAATMITIGVQAPRALWTRLSRGHLRI